MEHKINHDDFRVQYIDMEYGIHEQIHDAKDGTYTIFLNAHDSYDMQVYSYQHAIEHIRENHFELEECDVQSIELKAHGMDTSEEPVMPQEEIQRRIEQLRKRKRANWRKYNKWRKHKELIEMIREPSVPERPLEPHE